MQLTVAGRRVRAATGGADFDPSVPAIVFLHGAGMDRTAWALIGRSFAHGGFSVLAPDLPGHGASEGPCLTSIGEAAGWVIDLADAAGLRRVNLVGHSFGSLIALETGAATPDRVASITLLGVADVMAVHPGLMAAARADDHLAVELIASWNHTRRTLLGRHPTPGLTLHFTDIRVLERAAPGVIATDLAACAAYRTAVDRAAGVKCPALVFIGSRDRMTPPAAATRLAAALADVTVVDRPEAGHLMMSECPDAVIPAVRRFLTESLPTV